jgi:23S rRNA pseudouridine1911/1915/1917 synthase
MLSIGTEKQKSGTAHQLINEYLRKQSSKGSHRAYVVHRLDRETSGLLLLAKSAEIQERLQTNWTETEKIYIAIVEGTPEPAEDTIRSYLSESSSLRVYSGPAGKDSQLAITHYRILQTTGEYSRIEIQLETGRKHQIRVHMADRGNPVVGDPKYDARSDPLGRLGLHAWQLRFIHPVGGESLEFTAEMPDVFRKLVSE